MRFGAAVALLTTLVFAAAGCGGASEFFRDYEYEEEMFLALDGSATVYVNASLPALNALRGTSFETRPSARIDRDALNAYYTSPVTTVDRLSQSRRHGRRFAHIRVAVRDVNQLGQAAPFAWSTYRLSRDGDFYTFKQSIGASAGANVGDVGWEGDEHVAFRLHLPSAIVYHNAGADNLRRGNILVWEQTLAARLRGEPLVLDARTESQSILSRTLLLFAGTAVAVLLLFMAVIWWVVRNGRRLAP
jgi:hypothetical protein